MFNRDYLEKLKQYVCLLYTSLVIYMFILSDSQQPITPARLIINHHGCCEAIKNP